MLKLLIKNKQLWIPALIIILLLALVIVFSKYGFNPLGYAVY